MLDPGVGRDSIGHVNDVYLLGVRLAGRRVVAVGAGHVLARRLETLLEARPDLRVIAPSAHPDIVRATADGRLTWDERPYAPGDLDGAWFTVAATDDAEVNAAVVAEAEARRTFCVRADDGARGSAVTPATTRRGAVQVGVVSGGDFRASRRLRDDAAAWLASDPDRA